MAKDVWKEHIPILTILDKNLDRIQYPVVCSPKPGGIRCITDHDGTPCLINGSVIKNDYIRTQIKNYGVPGLDGDIIIDSYDVVNTLSAVRKFKFIIHDKLDSSPAAYYHRMQQFNTIVPTPRPEFIRLTTTALCYNADGIREYWKQCALNGAHGIYIRRTTSNWFSNHVPPYSIVWSDLDWCEYFIWKVSTAIIVGFNKNPDEDTLESLVVKDIKTKQTFSINQGFTLRERNLIWKNSTQYMGMKITYKYQPVDKQIPGSPVYTGTIIKG